MAWTTPTSRSNGDIITPTEWNTDLVNNLNHLYNRVITGRIAGAGTITAGTGFTVNRSATGQFDVTFTSSFAATPLVTATSEDGTGVFIVGVTAVTSSTFTVKVKTDANVASNTGFNFTARPVL